MEINKKDIIRLLEQIALYMELKGENPFKISAFRKAAGALEADDRSLSEIDDFTKIPSIGKGTAAVIEEYIESGTSSALSELQEEVPKGLIPLLQIPGMGGKTIAKLYKELNVSDEESLRLACEAGKIRGLKGFGKKKEEKIMEALKELGRQPDRLPIGYMMPIAEEIERALADIEEIERYSRAGSLRRVRETVKDLDFIIATTKPEIVKDKLLHLDGFKETSSAGDTKITMIMEEAYRISVDFRLVAPKEYATALHHFTGSAEHNVRMRQIAKTQGEKISEYGVEDSESGEISTFDTEEAFFSHFGLPYIPPEIREDGKEIELYTGKNRLISAHDIKGDLHMHTTWSDGAFSIEEMVEACRRKGYRYMAITDHSQYLKVANGLTVDRLKRQQEEIRDINEKYSDILVLSGTEMDILPDGSLDFDDEVLAGLDIVIASIHSSFSQSREQIMKRLKNALENPHVDIIAHPTGRLIGKREGYDADVQELIDLAAQTNTVLELNANPARLDLAAEHLRMAQAKGVKLVINTDAHNMGNLEFMDLGASFARRGWVRPDTVLNAWSKEELESFLRKK